MHNVHYILLVFSFVFALLGAVGTPSGRYNFHAAAFACYIATMIM